MLTRFVGHSAELERLVDLTEGERLVTLTGPGGGGKTRLAVELARDAQRRGQVVWLAEIAPVRDGELVAETVAAAVGLEDVPDPVEQLLTQPERLDGLLVLDNCEHLLDDCAALTGTLLAAAPGLRVLATSREPLGLTGERVWPVKPLELPDESTLRVAELAQVESVELLLDRARAVRPDLEIGTDEVRSVVQVCRALDGIPLAIELAAGRLRSLSLGDLASHLGNLPVVLARHRSTGLDDARHQTLRLTLDWSYDLLTEEEQLLARCLSIFNGGFRLDAVEAVCGGDLDVFDGVDELVAKSLVAFDGVTARYRMLEPLRQHLTERLDESGAAETVRRAHGEWVAGMCDRLGLRLLDDQKNRSLRLNEEIGNIDLALRWAHDHDHTVATRIIGSLGQYWCYYDQASGRRWCNTVNTVGADVAPRARAKALLSAAIVAQNDFAWNRSIAYLREALAIYQDAGATAGQAASLFWLGRGLASRWDPKQADVDTRDASRCFEESLGLLSSVDDPVGVGWCRIWLSTLAFWDDDLDRSGSLANRVLEECSAAGAFHPVGAALRMLAYVAHRRGQGDAALELLHEAAALYRDLHDPWQLTDILPDLAAQAAHLGRGAEALQALAESSQVDDQIGRLPRRSSKLAAAAVVHLDSCRRPLAVSALGAYDAHTPEGPPKPVNRVGGYIGWFIDAVATTRAQLDPVAVAAATAAARRKSLDELIDELIIQPANAAEAAAPRSTNRQPDNR